MFDWLIKTVDNALGIGSSILDGETPSRESVAKLIADGLSVAVIAAMFGVGIDVIEQLVEGNDENGSS